MSAAISARIAAISALASGCAATPADHAREAATTAATRLFRIDFAPVLRSQTVRCRGGGHNATGRYSRVTKRRRRIGRPGEVDPRIIEASRHRGAPLLRMLAAIVLGAMLSTCSSPPSVLERILRSGRASGRHAQHSGRVLLRRRRAARHRVRARARLRREARREPAHLHRRPGVPGPRVRQSANRRGEPHDRRCAPRQRDVRPRLPADRAADRLSARHAAAAQARRPRRRPARGRRELLARGAAREAARARAAADLDRAYATLERGADPPRGRGRDRLHGRRFASVRAAAPLLSRPARRVPARPDRPASPGRCRRATSRCARASPPISRRSKRPASSSRSSIAITSPRASSTTSARAPSCATSTRGCRAIATSSSKPSARRASTGVCSRRSPIKSRTGTPQPCRRRACAA